MAVHGRSEKMQTKLPIRLHQVDATPLAPILASHAYGWHLH
jgi:hypothetical protein